MNKARSDNHIIPLGEYRDIYHGKLRCYYCNALVTFVTGHQYSRGDKVVDVQSCYRLMPSQKHEDNCLYDVKEVVKSISHALADSSLMSEEGGHFVVRILMKGDEIDNNNAPTLSAEPEEEGISHTRTGNSKTAYISSLLKLACLWSIVENQEELKRLVKLKVRQENNKRLMEVKWEDFCYNPEDFPRLYKSLKENTIHHPICIIGKYSLKDYLKYYPKDPLKDSLKDSLEDSHSWKSLVLEYKKNDSTRYPVQLSLSEEQYSTVESSKQTKPMVVIYVDDIRSVWCKNNDWEGNKNNERNKNNEGKIIIQYYNIYLGREADMKKLHLFNPEDFAQ